MKFAHLAAEYQSYPEPEEFDDEEELKLILEEAPDATREKSLEIRGRYLLAEKEFVDKLRNMGLVFDRSGSDEYDNSVELYAVDDQQRLTPNMQEFIFNEGFATVFVNHKNNWETHYNWDCLKPFEADEGWRVSYGHKNQSGQLMVEKFPEKWKDSPGLLAKAKVVSPEEKENGH